jgi:uncharacterized protein YcaQ
MSTVYTINLCDARQLALFAQGLLSPNPLPASKTDVNLIIQQLGILQIDTINVVARSPYFALWSRLGNYDPDWLDQLLEEKRIFEYWAHAASFLPGEDFPLHRRCMIDRMRVPGYEHWYNAHKNEADAVLEHIKKNGPVRSADFERQDGQRGTWWNWKIEKEALEYWFSIGELTIIKRNNFQRVYDLRERVYPDWNDQDTPDLDSVAQAFLLKSIAAMGIARESWLRDYYRLSKALIQKALKTLISNHSIHNLQVDGWSDSIWVSSRVWEEFKNTNIKADILLHTTLLSPFDSLIWDRKRTLELFDFDYKIECYTPAPKRIFGYFCLPILSNGEIVGRLDAKAHRADKRFEVKALYLEKRGKPNLDLARSIAKSISQCAEWHKTPQVVLGKCEPQEFKTMIEKFF